MDIFGRCENADPQDIEGWKNHMDSRYKAQRDKLRAACQLLVDSLEGKPVHPEEAIGAIRDALEQTEEKTQ